MSIGSQVIICLVQVTSIIGINQRTCHNSPGGCSGFLGVSVTHVTFSVLLHSSDMSQGPVYKAPLN